MRRKGRRTFLRVGALNVETDRENLRVGRHDEKKNDGYPVFKRPDGKGAGLMDLEQVQTDSSWCGWKKGAEQ